MPQALAKIYQPTKTAMQSGRARTKAWKLEYAPIAPRVPDAVMGWSTMPNTLEEVHLYFPGVEEAVAYAEAKKIPYEVVKPHAPISKPKAYAENFAAGKRVAFDENC